MLLIKNGRVIDPGSGTDARRNIWIDGERIARLAPAGRLLVGNMVPENPTRWIMEHHLDWQLVYRSRAELLEIARRAAPAAHAQILEEESGVNPFVELTRD